MTVPYESTSYRNMVAFYAPELRRIISGESIVEVFPTRVERRRLLRQGLIRYTGTRGNRRSNVAERALILLEESPAVTP